MMVESSDRPRKRRPLWLKVMLSLLLVAALIIGGGLMAHAIWRGKAQARADAMVAKIRAAGEPITVEELVDEPVPDARNIVVLFRNATAAYIEDKPRRQRQNEMATDDPDAFTPPLNDVEVALLREEVTANTAALQILAGLDSRDGIEWNNPPTTPAVAMLLPELREARQLAILLSESARVVTHEGRHVEALDAVQDIGPIANAIAKRPGIVGYLVAVGIRALQAEELARMSPELDYSDRAVRSRAETFIRELIHDESIHSDTRNGVMTERVLIHDTLRAMVAGKITPTQMTGMPPVGGAGGGGLQSYALAPLAYNADAVALEYLSVALEHSAAPSLPAFRVATARMRAIEKEVTQSKADLLAQIMLPSFGRIFVTKFHAMTDRHLVATALAIRLYQQDHVGARPPTLEALVPTYLPAVPTDAMDGKPLRYDSVRGIVWSVGEDEADDGGDATRKRPNQRGRWSMRDAVLHLDRQPRPTTTPTTLPATPALVPSPGTPGEG